MSDAMRLPPADGDGREGGWTLDPGFLRTIRSMSEVIGGENGASMEQVEQTLLAYRAWLIATEGHAQVHCQDDRSSEGTNRGGD